MAKIIVKNQTIKTLSKNGVDYICITDIARQKNAIEPKDVVKNWLRSKNTLEYLGLWEQLNNPNFKGVEFDPLLKEAGSNAFTMSPTRWVEVTHLFKMFKTHVLIYTNSLHPTSCSYVLLSIKKQILLSIKRHHKYAS